MPRNDSQRYSGLDGIDLVHAHVLHAIDRVVLKSRERGIATAEVLARFSHRAGSRAAGPARCLGPRQLLLRPLELACGKLHTIEARHHHASLLHNHAELRIRAVTRRRNTGALQDRPPYRQHVHQQ